MSLHHVFLGNPGSGKSTTLNGLLGTNSFASGMSYGSGKTQAMLKHVGADGSVYLDTPGLADTKIREQAGAAIVEALKQGGEYKIFFVFTLEGGRVRPTDVATMALVLQAAPEIGSYYGVIINKASKKAMASLKDPTSQDAQLLTASLFATVTPSPFVIANPLDPDLNDEDDVVKPLPRPLIEFVQNLRPVKISPDQVSPIQVGEFDAMAELMENRIADLQGNNELLQQVLQAQQRALEQQRQDFENRARENERREAALREQIERANVSASLRGTSSDQGCLRRSFRCTCCRRRDRE